MHEIKPCPSEKELHRSPSTVYCTVCGREMDYLTSFVSDTNEGAIYICFESIKQKIFVYGKYLGGKYGAIKLSKYYTKEECAKKVCEEDIKKVLSSVQKEEYSRLITCQKGNMEAIILSQDIVNNRKKDLIDNYLNDYFNNPKSERKYYCHRDAAENDFRCQCGEELIRLGSERHRDLSGMQDQKFMELFLGKILSL
ncbi:MAG: hypothetical protein JW807_10730 [Spirochaetes bacterium]|nr:hypothetical protein [Spirochaetota bacterium]